MAWLQGCKLGSKDCIVVKTNSRQLGAEEHIPLERVRSPSDQQPQPNIAPKHFYSNPPVDNFRCPSCRPAGTLLPSAVIRYNHMPEDIERMRVFIRGGGGDAQDGLSHHVCYYDAQPPDRITTPTSANSVFAYPRGMMTRAPPSRRIRINISGHYFETSIQQLENHPETLLGDSSRRRKHYDRSRDEFFFDRHRPSFEAIFEYYQTGARLKRPPNVPDDVFLAELEFYQLEKQAVENYRQAEGYTTEEVVLPADQTQRRVWLLFENPETSRCAYAMAIISVIVTLVSIILFCVETLPVFAMTHCTKGGLPNFLDPFFVIESFCTAWFTLEAVVRFAVCPDKLAYWKDFKNIVDVTAVVPYYVTFVNVVYTMNCATAKSSASLAFLRVIRLVRVFKLTKHSVGFQILIMTFRASFEGLLLFLVALFVCLLVFSSAIYYAELGIPRSQIHSIPDAFWWAIITMTTVGYGDKVPVGPWGRLIGSACALTGVLTLAIPIPIITGHFNRFYLHRIGNGAKMK